jgi:general secretion pathway protein G
MKIQSNRKQVVCHGILCSESGRGLPHSKTLSRVPGTHETREASWSAAALCRYRRATEQELGRSRNHSGGFTLIEIMVVVIILGILAATIIPQFVGTTHDAKVSTAKSNIAELESALERFNVNMDRYPTTEEGLKALTEAPPGEEQKWRGPYIKLLRPDPWNNQYQYKNPGTHKSSGYDLWSRGADGVDGGEGDGADIGNWN